VPERQARRKKSKLFRNEFSELFSQNVNRLLSFDAFCAQPATKLRELRLGAVVIPTVCLPWQAARLDYENARCVLSRSPEELGEFRLEPDVSFGAFRFELGKFCDLNVKHA
jgi:hypothetical protein